MARRRLSHFDTRNVPQWRERVRDKIKLLTRAAAKEVRIEVARKIADASEEKVYRVLKVKGRERRERAHERILDVKRKIVKRLHPTWDDTEIDALAARSTLLKGEDIRRADFRGKRFIRVKGKSWKRAKLVKVRGEKRYVAYGQFISEASVNRSLAARVYWSRVKSLAAALEIPILEARKADKLLLEVPDAARRRIYERLVDMALKTKEHRPPPKKRTGKRRVKR